MYFCRPYSRRAQVEMSFGAVTEIFIDDDADDSNLYPVDEPEAMSLEEA